ncbi:DinB family protein [Parapedobacter sp. SGR-10]|uniref:DinB family protein n=1 Tax=Parapedobacter sp. SGR-10 TaxID=2710879 RepID=UPI0013D2A3B8|nr:DinB family protein [Parapedobacter sp. SGR-10]NGF55690.1 DinB family protein [Parapedobacter sp. SGR-10]
MKKTLIQGAIVVLTVFCTACNNSSNQPTKSESKMDNKTITDILASQYKASLGMLRQALEKVPEEQWSTEEYNNPNWQIAYHVLWGTKFYLGANPESYVPFDNAIEGAESLGGNQDWENPEEGTKIEGFHTKEELISFIDNIESNLLSSIEALPLNDNSGFEWYPYSRLELHINNIRHIQHHTAQIIERLKAKGITGFPWRADQNPPQEW